MSDSDGAAMRQTCSSSAGAASTARGGRAHELSVSPRRQDMLRRMPHNWSEQPPFPPEVQVKNTFLHVEDENTVVLLQRSWSDTDLDKAASLKLDGSLTPLRVKPKILASTQPASSSTRATAEKGCSAPEGSAPPSAEAAHATSASAQFPKHDAGHRGRFKSSSASSPSDRPSAPSRADYEGFDGTPGSSSSAHWGSTRRTRPPASSFSAASEPGPADSANDDDHQDYVDHDEGGEWSVGSAEHDGRNCRPCAYYRTTGCTKGRSCRFCHLPHQRKMRVRPCKAKRTQCKQIVAMLDHVNTSNQEEAADHLRRMCAETGATDPDTFYLIRILASRARGREEEYYEQHDAPGRHGSRSASSYSLQGREREEGRGVASEGQGQEEPNERCEN